MIKIAVIGYGHLGKWHCEKVDYLVDSELVAIVDPSEKSVSLARKRFPNVKIVPRVEDILADIDAAIVVSPTSTHFEIVKILLSADKHVFCEKPLCNSLFEAEEIKKIYKKKNVVFQVGHSERFHKAWQIIDGNDNYRSFLDAIGTLRVSRLAPFKGRATDVDVVQDLMVHDVDLLVFLFNEIPQKVKSTGYKIRTKLYDYVCSEFSFRSGRRAIVTVGRNHVKEIRELEYTSPMGCMYIDMFTNEVLIAPNGKVAPTKKKLSEFVEVVSYDKQDHLLVEQELFYDSIKSSGPAIVTFEDGILAVKLISRVIESLESGKEVDI